MRKRIWGILCGAALVLGLPAHGMASSVWDSTTGITIDSAVSVGGAPVTAMSRGITITGTGSLTIMNGKLNGDSAFNANPLEFTNATSIFVKGDSTLEDRNQGRAVITGGSMLWDNDAALTSNRLTFKNVTDIQVGARAGSMTTSGLGIDSSRLSIPLVAMTAADAPINLGYAGNGYTSSGSGILKLNTHQSGSVDLSTITLRGLVQDSTKANIAVGQTSNVYLMTGVSSIVQGSSESAVTDLSGIRLTTDDVLFSMSGLTLSGSDLLVAVSRRAAQNAMPNLPSGAEWIGGWIYAGYQCLHGYSSASGGQCGASHHFRFLHFRCGWGRSGHGGRQQPEHRSHCRTFCRAGHVTGEHDGLAGFSVGRNRPQRW